MNYAQTIEFLYSQLPMYSRIGKAAYKTDLTNTLLLCEILNHPEKKFRSIHIAGTNGKGSTSHMLAAILQQCGYKTGLYTSPHLKDFRERIRINGMMIPEEYVIGFVEKYKDDVSKIECSFFEWTVGLAFDYFVKEEVEIAVIETGLGGRLDSTNVITPLLSVITNVSYDHMDLLGDTLEKIAIEKAGIIKPGIPVVIGESDGDNEDEGNVSQVFRDVSKEKNAPIYFADKNFRAMHSKVENQKLQIEFDRTGVNSSIINIESDLTGSYQEKNIATVLQSVDVLKELGWKIPADKIPEALSQVKKLTGLRGRWEILSDNPLIVADVAHNEAGIKYAMQQLKAYEYERLHFVIGFVKEKDLSAILKLFPIEATYYFCRPDIPRGLDEETLRQSANKAGLVGESYVSISEAFDSAKKNALSNDLIYVGGSTFVVAEIL